jgi:hypothetical protein
MKISIIPILTLSKEGKSETFLRVLEHSKLGCVERLGYHTKRYHSISLDDLRFDRTAVYIVGKYIGRREDRKVSSEIEDRSRIGPPAIKAHSRVTAE